MSLRNALACAIFGTAAASGCAQVLGYRSDYYEAPEVADSGGDVVGRDTTGGDTAIDGAGIPDARAQGDDALDAADGGAFSFCRSLNPPPLFCEDFDEDVPLISAWSYLHQITGALAIYRAASTSPPASMIAQSNVVMGPNVAVDTAAYESFALSGQTFQGAIDLDLRVDQVDSSTGVAVLAQFGLTDGNGNGLYFLQFVTNSNGPNPLTCLLAEDYFAANTSGSPTDHPIGATIPLKMWTHVQLSLAVPFAGGAGTAAVRINGGPPNTTAVQVPVKNFSQTIGVGLLYASTPSNGWTVVVDNVVFDATTN